MALLGLYARPRIATSPQQERPGISDLTFLANHSITPTPSDLINSALRHQVYAMETSGKTWDVFRLFYAFGQTLPDVDMTTAIANNFIPWFSLHPGAVPWADIASGAHDDYIDHLGDWMAALAVPMYFCFHHEPTPLEGHVPGVNPGDPPTMANCTDFRLAVARLKTRMDARGATNVKHTTILMRTQYASGYGDFFYPGDGILDVIGVDAYNFFNTPCRFQSAWLELASALNPARTYALAKGLPFAVGETGLMSELAPGPRIPPPGATKGGWITNALNQFKTWGLGDGAGQLLMLCWFFGAVDWWINEDTNNPQTVQCSSGPVDTVYATTASVAAYQAFCQDDVWGAAPGDVTAPTTPTGLMTTPLGASSIQLDWTASTDDVGVTGYTIYRDGVPVASTSGTGVTYTDTGLFASTTYSYQVQAFDAAGNRSGLSTAVPGTTSFSSDVISPTVPGNLSAHATGAPEVDLDWDASTDADSGVVGYRVYRDGSAYDDVPASQTDYVDQGVVVGGQYSYTVDAVDVAGNRSAQSGAVAVQVPAFPVPPFILRCLDDNELSVLLDLTELNNGEPAGFGIPPEAFNLGGGELEDDWIEDPGYDGGIQVTSSRPRTAMTFPLLAFGLDNEDLRTRMRLLGQLLDRPRTWEYAEEGSTTTRLIDAARSPIPRLLAGGENDMRNVMRAFGNGVQMEIRRQPKLRGRRKSPIVNITLSNAPTENVIQITNPGNVRSPVRWSIRPNEDDSNLVRVRVGRKSFGNLTEFKDSFAGFYISEAAFPAGSGTTGGTSHADAESPNGFVAQTAFTGPGLVARFRQVLSPLDESALDGTYRVLIGCKPDPGAVYTFQLRSGLNSNAETASPQELVTWDLSDATSVDSYLVLDAGFATYDAAGIELVLEMWASCSVSGKNCKWMIGVPMPASESLLEVTEPTYLFPTAGSTVWDDPATSFIVAGDIDLPSTDAVDSWPAQGFNGDFGPAGTTFIDASGRLMLGRAPTVPDTDYPDTGMTPDHEDKTDEAVMPAPITGIRLNTGNWVFVMTVQVHDTDKRHITISKMVVRDLTDSVDVGEFKFYNTAGQTDTVVSGQVPFTVTDASHDYAFMVVQTYDRTPNADTGGVTVRTYVLSGSYAGARAISRPEKIVWEGRAGRNGEVRAYGQLFQGATHSLIPSGPPEAEAGLNDFVFFFEYLPPLGLGNIDARGPVSAFSALKTHTLQGDLDAMHIPE